MMFISIQFEMNTIDILAVLETADLLSWILDRSEVTNYIIQVSDEYIINWLHSLETMVTGGTESIDPHRQHSDRCHCY